MELHANRCIPQQYSQVFGVFVMALFLVAVADAAFAQNVMPLPVVELITPQNQPPGTQFQQIDGVIHGTASVPSNIRFLYGVPITEWSDGEKRHLKIGSIEVAPLRIDAVKTSLPDLELPARVSPLECRWLVSPFDGTLEASSRAFCSTTSATKETLYRTNPTQAGDGPVAPEIISFPILKTIQNSLTTDRLALSAYQPYQPDACDIHFDQLAKAYGPEEARAYLSAWKAEQPQSTHDLVFDWPILDYATLRDFQKYFVDQFASIEKDLGDLPAINSDRMKTAFRSLPGAGIHPPSPDAIQRMNEALTAILEGWLTPQCRDVLYLTSTIPRDPYIFRDDLFSKNQLVVLLRVWQIYLRHFQLKSLGVAAERRVDMSPYDAVEALKQAVNMYDLPSQLSEPDFYKVDDLRKFRLLPGIQAASRLSVQTELALFESNTPSKEEHKVPYGGKNRREFDPRRWQLIVEFNTNRLTKEFDDNFRSELLKPQVNSGLRLTQFKQKIVENTTLARSLGMPGSEPWLPPRFRRAGVVEGVPPDPNATHDLRPRWYDDELFDSLFVLTEPGPDGGRSISVGGSGDVWIDSKWFRVLSDLDEAEWAIYNETINQLLSNIDSEISRMQLGAEYTEVDENLKTVDTALGGQVELLFGGEPFRLEECSAALSADSIHAGDEVARIRPAFRHLIEVKVPNQDPLVEVLSSGSRISLVFSSLVGTPSEKGGQVRTSSFDANNAYIAEAWANAARFAGRVLSIIPDANSTRIEVEVFSTPEQDTIALEKRVPTLSDFPGVLADGAHFKLVLDGGILGNIEQANVVIMPRSEREREQLKSIIESEAFR